MAPSLVGLVFPRGLIQHVHRRQECHRGGAHSSQCVLAGAVWLQFVPFLIMLTLILIKGVNAPFSTAKLPFSFFAIKYFVGR